MSEILSPSQLREVDTRLGCTQEELSQLLEAAPSITQEDSATAQCCKSAKDQLCGANPSHAVLVAEIVNLRKVSADLVSENAALKRDLDTAQFMLKKAKGELIQ